MTDFRLEIPCPRSGDEAPPALQVVATDIRQGVTVVAVRGDLDTITAVGFDRWVRDKFDGRSDVVLDLDGVIFLASAGIAVLMGLRQEAARQDVRLHITGARNRAVHRPLQVLGLEAVLGLQPDAPAVVAELAPSR